MPDPVDFSAGLDGLQEDMAAHQRRQGLEPTAEANRELALSEVQRWDRQAAEDGTGPAAPAPTPPVSAPVPDAEVVTKRETGLLAVDADRTAYKPVDERTQRLIRTMGARVELLMSKTESGPLGAPSWAQRLDAVMALRARAAEHWKAGELLVKRGVPILANACFVASKEVERRYMHELKELLEASSATFGDWRKEPERKVVVAG